ncbi:hypothetical protein HDU87_003995 [Geranomyces variabilis]|uniref:Endoplasmic reticulum-based factor for assembly of V-ATPase-domain-containing protein n=1 Tax=Geranomyces variabilis TaxID=109894 RepID=A0AAD5TQZ5_9FUNG|nr:hypothetical protein HDU87_003995 [Geranomyces variabilis]
MVLLAVTPAIAAAVARAGGSTTLSIPLALRTKLVPYHKNERSTEETPASEQQGQKDHIPHSLLAELSAALIAATGQHDQYSLHVLIRGSSLHLPKPPPAPPKSARLLALLDAAQAELSNREYAEMTRGLSTPRGGAGRVVDDVTLNIGGELRDAFRSVSAVFNVLLSMGAVFVAVYWVAGTVSRDVGKRTLLGLFGALMVAIAEGWFFAKDLMSTDGPPAKHTNLRTKKTR